MWGEYHSADGPNRSEDYIITFWAQPQHLAPQPTKQRHNRIQLVPEHASHEPSAKPQAHRHWSEVKYVTHRIINLFYHKSVIQGHPAAPTATQPLLICIPGVQPPDYHVDESDPPAMSVSATSQRDVTMRFRRYRAAA